MISKGQITRNRRGSEFKGIIELDDKGEDLGEKEDMQGHYHKPKKKESKSMNDFSGMREQVHMGVLVDTQWLRTQVLKSDRPVSESQFCRVLVL